MFKSSREDSQWFQPFQGSNCSNRLTDLKSGNFNVSGILETWTLSNKINWQVDVTYAVREPSEAYGDEFPGENEAL
jgi:hypothetical protein